MSLTIFFYIKLLLSANWKKLRAAGHHMSAILEESDGATKVVFPKPAEVVDIAGDEDVIVPPIESMTEVEPVAPVHTVPTSARFHVGSMPNVVFVLSENHDLTKLNTFYVLVKDHVAVMVRNQSDGTLEDLTSYLLQKYPECGLVTPKFSAENVEKSPSKFKICMTRTMSLTSCMTWTMSLMSCMTWTMSLTNCMTQTMSLTIIKIK